MKYAIVDIGSNSMRLTVYETEDNGFKILLKQKIIAGLAGYVKNEKLTKKGMTRAADGLLKFKETIDAFDIKNVSVFATASLRNIKNTDEAAAEISAASGYKIEVISGEEEAFLGYIGATYNNPSSSAPVVDIGGASTEISLFDGEKPLSAVSFPVGSLKLYVECVKEILPDEKCVKRIKNKIKKTINIDTMLPLDGSDSIVCIGGSARGTLKIARYMFDMSSDTYEISKEEFDAVCACLLKCDKKAYELILKTVPERIHTIIPGILILKYIVCRLNVNKISVGKFGVREGYLCRNILKINSQNTDTPKTES